MAEVGRFACNAIEHCVSEVHVIITIMGDTCNWPDFRLL